MADWALLGGIGKGVTEGLEDKRRMDEAAQMKQLRQYQLDQLKEDANYRTSLKGLRKVGSATYDNSFQKQGAGVDQAKTLDAQTADFGAEGAQLTADALAGAKGLSKAAPVKSTPYEASDQARDIADLALKAGKPEIAAQFGDRAFTLGTREVQDRVNKWARSMQSMSLADAAKSLADLHTADKTDFGAFMRKDPTNPEGLPEVTLFNAKTGAYETHTVKNKEELLQFGQSLVDHNARNEIQKQQTEQAKLGLQARGVGAQETSANAAATNAETQKLEFNAKKDAGLFIAQADSFKAQAEAHRMLSPAQAEQARAHAEYFSALGNELKAKANSWEGKLSDTEKFFLNGLKETALKAAHDSVLDPTDANKEAAKAAKYQLAVQMNQFGAKGFDPYAYSGAPRPEEAARAILSDKPNDKSIALSLQKASIYGTDYVNKVKEALDAQKKQTPAVGTSNAVAPAPSMTPGYSLSPSGQYVPSPTNPVASTNAKEIVNRMVEINDRLKNLPMGNEGRLALTLEYKELQQQLNGGGSKLGLSRYTTN